MTSLIPENPIDAVANAELKALTYLGLDSEGPKTTSGISTLMDEHLGIDRTSAGGYVAPLEGLGYASSERAVSDFNARIVLKFTAELQDLALPAVGEMLDWSDTYDIPLRMILGATSSYGSRSPSNSIAVLRQLLSGKVPIAHLEVPFYRSKEPHSSRVYRLIDDEILVEADSTFKINDPTYTGNRPFKSLRPERQHIYKILRQLEAINPGREWTVQEVARIAEKTFGGENPKIGIQFYQLVRRAASKSAPHDFSGAIHKIDMTTREVEINPVYMVAASDIVERVTKLAEDASRQRKVAIARAKELYEDRVTAQTLARRDMDSSGYRSDKNSVDT
jgi:hypothetical protein